jgi:hypothetical protein
MATITVTMTDQLHSKNLVPFKKRRGAYDIPGMTGENEEHTLDDVDQDLSREEQRFIRHYLGYADALLKSAPDSVSGPQENSLHHAKAADAPSVGGTSDFAQKDIHDKDSSHHGSDKAA